MDIPDSPFWLSGAFSGKGGWGVTSPFPVEVRCGALVVMGKVSIDLIGAPLEGNPHTSGGRNGAGLLRCAHTASGIPGRRVSPARLPR